MIFVFANMTGTPVCSAGVGPRGSMVGEYALCAGSGLFPNYDHSYSLAGLQMGVFAQGLQGATTLRFADPKACAPAV